MKILSGVHTHLGTWFALKLFFTPLRFPVPAREKAARERATVEILTTAKSEFRLFSWGKGTKKVLLMHGWSGRATQFFKIIESLEKDGYKVYSIEAPGHGKSDQRKTHMLEFVETIEVVNEKYGPFSAAIGHSLGGMAIFNAMKDSRFAPGRVVIIGTPASIDNVVMDFCHKVEAPTSVGTLIIRYIEKRYNLKIGQAATENLAGQLNPEGLIIHDKADKDVGIENAHQIKEKWQKAGLVITKGLGHRKILMNPEIIENILKKLKD